MLKSFKKAIGMNKKASVPEKKEVQVQVEVQDVDNTITLEQCLFNKDTRDECLRRILASAGLHPCRPLGASKSEHLDLPDTSHAFNTVAGAILDPAGTKMVAVVDKSGKIERLPESRDNVLPPYLAGDRPVYAIGNVSANSSQSTATNGGVPPGVRPPDRPTLGVFTRARGPLPPIPAKLRTSNASSSEQTNTVVVASAVPNAPPLFSAENTSSQYSKASASAASSSVPNAPASDIPIAPPFVYSKPLINGQLPVVTPATKKDAKILEKNVAKAPFMQADAHTSLMDEIRAKKKAHEQATNNGTLKAPAYQKTILQSGNTFTPVLHDVRTAPPVDNRPDDLMTTMKKQLAQRQANMAGVVGKGVNARGSAQKNVSPSPNQEWDED